MASKGICVCNTAFYSAEKDGSETYYKVGDMVSGSDKVLKGNGEFFTQMPDGPDHSDPRFAEPTGPETDPEPAAPESSGEEAPAAERAPAKRAAKKA